MGQSHLSIHFYGFGESFNAAMSDFTSGLIDEYVWCYHIADTGGSPYRTEDGNKTVCKNVLAITLLIITFNIILGIFKRSLSYI